MKIMLVCAGGMSTGVLMRKMIRYWKEIGEPLEVFACGLADYREQDKPYDLVLVGPQVAYRLAQISEDVKVPCAAINSTDYALGDCEKIYQQACALYEKGQNAWGSN